MKIIFWVDDLREPPSETGYCWCKSVNEAKRKITYYEGLNHVSWLNNEIFTICCVDIDHDAGDFASDGGDYIKLLEWLEETGRNYPIRIHSMNPVGVQNMRRIIERNGWTEVR